MAILGELARVVNLWPGFLKCSHSPDRLVAGCALRGVIEYSPLCDLPGLLRYALEMVLC